MGYLQSYLPNLTIVRIKLDSPTAFEKCKPIYTTRGALAPHTGGRRALLAGHSLPVGPLLFSRHLEGESEGQATVGAFVRDQCWGWVGCEQGG